MEKGTPLLSHRHMQILMVGHSLLDIGFVIYVVVLYQKSDFLEGQNKGAKLWIKAEIIT